ncbi:FkbM family methyltransferase [Variovorax beijingensis]|nr:FkbM family methyltransferase [Variovorax beijingensis]
MTTTSYAQNFEDVILWRALGHIPKGTYVDVGAQHPVVDSVSKAFYERGWRGVHVEPVPAYAALLRQDRPDETVLQVALSDHAGVLDLNVIAGTGLSTGVKAYANTHSSEHGFATEVVQVPMLPMSTALASLNGQQVHWLKIDVEGFEEQVLRGWDSKALRPWIIVIEATIPLSEELNYAGADSLLIDAGYHFVYFDGLNRFYTASEHADLADKLKLPPNVFDNAELSGTASSLWCRGLISRHQQAQETLMEGHQQAIAALMEGHQEAQATLMEEMAALRERIADVEMQLHCAVSREEQSQARAAAFAEQAAQAEARTALVETQLEVVRQQGEAIMSSTSWRITAPLRLAGKFAPRLGSAIRDGRLTSGLKRRVKTLLRTTIKALAHYPALRRMAAGGVALVPPLAQRLRAIATTPSTAPLKNEVQGVHALPARLSPDASVLFRQLMRQQERMEGT